MASKEEKYRPWECYFHLSWFVNAVNVFNFYGPRYFSLDAESIMTWLIRTRGKSLQHLAYEIAHFPKDLKDLWLRRTRFLISFHIFIWSDLPLGYGIFKQPKIIGKRMILILIISVQTFFKKTLTKKKLKRYSVPPGIHWFFYIPFDLMVWPFTVTSIFNVYFVILEYFLSLLDICYSWTIFHRRATYCGVLTSHHKQLCCRVNYRISSHTPATAHCRIFQIFSCRPTMTLHRFFW